MHQSPATLASCSRAHCTPRAVNALNHPLQRVALSIDFVGLRLSGLPGTSRCTYGLGLSLFPTGLRLTSVFASRGSQVKIGISHALAQSTKLSIFEERMTTLTDQAVELPKMLAATGMYMYAPAVSHPSLSAPPSPFPPAAAV